MGQIIKGKIASINENMARVVPLDATKKPTPMLMIPWHLRKKTGNLKKDTEVICVLFEDNTGLILSRVDGEWGEYLPLLKAETIRAKVVKADEYENNSGLEE